MSNSDKERGEKRGVIETGRITNDDEDADDSAADEED